MADRLDFWVKIKREMFSRINDVGAKPFLLFQYYLTYSTAKKINPTLKTIALDMGILDKKGKPQISAVSHLKKELINAGWIEEKDDEIFITFDLEKTKKVEKISSHRLRKSQLPIEKISSDVEKISTNSLENLNSPYKEEKEQEDKQEITREEESAGAENDFDYARVSFGKLSGISAADLVEPVQPLSEHLQTCEAGMKERLHAPKEIPRRTDWIASFKFWHRNEYPADEYLETFDALETIRVLKNKDWQVSPKMLENNLGKLESLRQEINRFENGDTNNGQYANKRKGNGEICDEWRDYFNDESEPIEISTHSGSYQ